MIEHLQPEGLDYNRITTNPSMNDSNTKIHQRTLSSNSNSSNFSNLNYFDPNSSNPGNLTPGKNLLHPNARPTHQPQLSINSINSVSSIIEPVTPPSNPNNYNSSSHHLGSEIDKDYLLSVNKVPLSQLKLEILKLAKDQYGCRFLQKKIDENLISNYSVRYANFEIIFHEIYLNLYELIIDPFGNYLIQKMIKYCSNENLNLMLEILRSNLFQISINQHGTRALQKIIENLDSGYQLDLLTSGLKPFIIELIKDLNGNHVIQKILNKFKPVQCQFIYDSILNDLITVATHKHGCCVLQKCLNHVTNKQLNQFVNEILSEYNFNKLINDQFGNYVLQYLISINNYQVHHKFFTNLVEFDLVNYCNLKFSSNVIEKFIKNCYNNETYHNEVRMNFVDLKLELMYHILKSPTNLNKLINDPFGNYVIQTLIDHLVNSHVDYSVVKPQNLNLLISPIPPTNDLIKYEVINIYFSNAKIVSSFGKRIQLKVSLVLSNHNIPNLPFASRTSQSSMDSPSLTYNPNSVDKTTLHVNVNPNVPPVMNTSQISPNSLNAVSGSFSSHVPTPPGSTPNSRSSSYPSIHSRSNSLQMNPQYNSNYILDKQLSNNFSNLKLNSNYYPVTTTQTSSSGTSVNVTPSQIDGQALYFMNMNVHPAVNNPNLTQINSVPQSSGQFNKFNSNGGNANATGSKANANGFNPYNAAYLNNNLGNMNTNMNQGYLKTPQIFSNVPANDIIQDSGQNFHYYG